MKEYKPLGMAILPDEFDKDDYGDEPIVEVEESKGRIVLTYSFPGFYSTEDRRDVKGKEVHFTQINMASTGFLAESGRPLLPAFNRYVQIPPNCEYSFRTKKGASMEFKDIVLLPAQEALTDQPNQEDVFEFDKQLYSKDTRYPKRMVQVTGPYNIDDYRALLVSVVPFQYNPRKKVLTGYASLTVTIEVRASKRASDTAGDVPEVDREAFGNLFLNPRRNVGGRLEMSMRRLRRLPRLRGPEFLILFDPVFEKSAQALAKWKNMRGLRTKAVPITDVGTTPSAIKEYLRSRRREASRLRYVLLFGDVDVIPPETVSGSPWGSNVTDYYYATASDPTSSTDLVLPWLAIGRIPVHKADEGKAVVRQTIDYEKKPPRASNYYERMTFAAYFQGDGTATRAYMKTMEDIREHMITLGFSVERVYVSQTGNVKFYIDGTPVPADVVASIVDSATATSALIAATSEGRLVAGHRDHGTDVGWHEPPFEMSHLDSVTGKMPSVFYSVNCLTGHFDLPSPTESFAEKILRMKGGAPTLIAATRVSHTWLNNDLMKALFDGTWGGVLPTFPGTTASYPVRHNRLGDILNYAKAYLPVAMSGGTEYIKDHFEIYHIVGDPTLEVWRGRPRRAKVSSWLDGKYLHIRLDHCVKDAVLTIWLRDRLLKRLEPSSDYVKVRLPSLSRLEGLQLAGRRPQLLVCFWAPGYRFRQIRPKKARARDRRGVGQAA